MREAIAHAEREFAENYGAAHVMGKSRRARLVGKREMERAKDEIRYCSPSPRPSPPGEGEPFVRDCGIRARLHVARLVRKESMTEIATDANKRGETAETFALSWGRGPG